MTLAAGETAGMRTRGTGIGQPPENLVEGAELAGQPGDAELIQAGGDEFGVPGSSGDVQQPDDAVGRLLPGGGMQAGGVKKALNASSRSN